MKTTLIFSIILVMLLSGCAASRELPEVVGKPLDSEVTDTVVGVPETKDDLGTEPDIPETTEATTADTEHPQTSTPTEATDPNNYFINNSNVVFEDNALTIRPKYVRWEGDMLVADCFVINGLDKPVYNISVGELTFTNLASAAFGKMEGAAIEARSYIVWTFYFNADTVQQLYGDLSSLECHFAVDYSY